MNTAQTLSITIEYDAEMSTRQFAGRLSEALSLPPTLAYSVAKDIRHHLRGEEPTEANVETAIHRGISRVLGAVESGWLRDPSLIRPGQAPVFQTSTGTPPLVAGAGIAGPVITGVVSGTVAATMDWLIKQNGGKADGASLVSENGGFIDDGNAPTIKHGTMKISLHKTEGRPCCVTGLGGKGIGVKVEFQATDNTGPWYSNDSGIVSTELSVVIGSGEDRALKSLGRYDYTSKEESSTEDGYNLEELDVCVPCAAVKDGVIYFVLKLTDCDGNFRIIVQPEPVGDEAQACCGKGK